MTRSTSPLIALMVLAALLAAPADAAQRTRKRPEPPPPPQFKVDVATRPMAMDRLALSIPAGSVIGKLKTGCFLSGSSEPLYTEHAFRGVPTQDYIGVFSAEAGAAGYRVASAQAGDLFTSGEAAKAELVVGAAILSLKADGCIDPGIMGFSTSMDSTVAVDWQVFDPLEKKIVFRGSNQGVAKVKVNQASSLISIEAARAAFREAAKAILADPNFVAAVKDPRGGPANGSNGALFPEAAAPSPGAAVPAATTPAAGPTRIGYLPLRAKPFREQVDELRGQVVTVRTPSSTGSAFYISDTLLLTNEHVVSGFNDVRVRFLGGREIAAQVLATDARRDVALLKTESAGVSGLALRLDNPELSSPVFVIGAPMGAKQEGSITAGVVSAFRDSDEGPLIQSDAGITGGNSGGPLFDDKGNVIGISVMIKVNQGLTTPINLFIPISGALQKLGLERAP